MENIEKRIRALTLSLLDAETEELVELTVRRQSQRLMIEIMVDKVSGGISLEECIVINKRISNILLCAI